MTRVVIPFGAVSNNGFNRDNQERDMRQDEEEDEDEVQINYENDDDGARTICDTRAKHGLGGRLC